jgi:hypothetical protein
LIQRAKHFGIIGHEISLEYFDNLKGDDETDGDEGAVEDEVRAEGDAGQLGALWRVLK